MADDIMHTKDKLALALTEAGLYEMAGKAATGYYHDFLSPLDLPKLALFTALGVAGTPAAMAIRDRVIAGEFDASTAESEAWAESAEGQETMGLLMPKRHKE